MSANLVARTSFALYVIVVMVYWATGKEVDVTSPSAVNLTESTPIVNVRRTTKRNITIGYLTSIRGASEADGSAISGALTYSLKMANISELPVGINIKWNDTKGDDMLGIKIMEDMICKGVSLFLGPDSKSCYIQAVIAQLRNVPMISYKCADYKASEVPTFARTAPSDTQITKAVLALLQYHQWNYFSIIYEDDWKTVAESLNDEALARNYTINHYLSVKDKNQCCKNNKNCCSDEVLYQMIKSTYEVTRIYVFVGSKTTLTELMKTMNELKLFDKGEYIVIYVDNGIYSESEAYRYLLSPSDINEMKTCMDKPNFKNIGSSLLVVVGSAPKNDYKNFTNEVLEYNKKYPFNFPSVFEEFNKDVTIYAAHLYDAVQLYVAALKELFQQEPFIDDAVIDRVVSNGTKIIQTIIKRSNYTSVMGTIIKIDKSGDSEGNFTVLAFKPQYHHIFGKDRDFSCDYIMRPIAGFMYDDSPKFKILQSEDLIDWISGKPQAIPACGYKSELCPQDTKTNSGILAITLGVILICALFLILSIIRKWKIKMEIKGLLRKMELTHLLRK